MRVRWLRSAVRDLHDICEYIANDNPSAATRIGTRIESSADLLAEHPLAGRTGRVPGTRELVITGTNYLVAYCVTAKSVDILAVLHGARKWPDRF
jgi:toxin ParE1/3/4